MTTRAKTGGAAKTIAVYFEKKLHKATSKRAKSLDRSLSQHLRILARQDMEGAK